MKMYRVNNELAMSLGSMLTHLEGLAHDFRNGKVSGTVKRIGRVLHNEDECWDLYHEIEILPCYGMSATSEEYGKLMQIKRERDYSRALANWDRG